MCRQSGEVVGREKKFCNIKRICWKKIVEGEVLSELVVFSVSWKWKNEAARFSWLQVWECNWAVANLSSTSPFLKICILVKSIRVWFCIFCLSLEPFLLIVQSAPALTCTPASARIAWICILWWQLMPMVMLDVSIVLDLWILFQQGFSEHCFKSVHSFH